jgi:hypothetical protein
MTKNDLIDALKALGVHENSYSIGQLKNSDCTCVILVNETYKVVYMERDKPSLLGEFESESEALDFVYATFRKWLGR